MKYIGLISDTHSYLDQKVFNHFKDCDEIWHAGDIGSRSLLEELANFKPLKAVFGNIDGTDIRSILKEDLYFECEGLRVFMTHIGGSPSKYPARVKQIILKYQPRLFICGHSHILKIVTDPDIPTMLHINPGAAGLHGFHTIRTLVRFKIDNGRIFDVQVIELGKRSTIKN